MKQGLTLQELATEVQRQATAKVDLLADTRELVMLNGREFAISGQGEFPLLSTAHSQVSDHLGIPIRYYDRLRTGDDDLHRLLDHNVNTLLRQKPATRMVRMLDGSIRAYLSDRYQRRDNDELLQFLMPVLGEIPDVKIVSCEVTSDRLYLKALAPRIQGEVKVGDVLQAGVMISNSEVGAGSLVVAGLTYRLVCTNGAISGDLFRQRHVGRRITGDDDGVRRVFRDETLQADDRAFWMATADLVRNAVSEANFQQTLAKMRLATSFEPLANVSAGVTELGKRFSLSEGEQESVITHLAAGGDLTKWGALNAVTRASQDVKSYQRATELETIGGQILDLTPADWRRIAQN